MKNLPEEKAWPGYPAPKETILPFLRQVLEGLDRCRKVHCSFTATDKTPPERHAVNFHFCLTWIFKGPFYASAAFEKSWERRELHTDELFLSGTGGWYAPEKEAANNQALAILFYPNHTRIVFSEFKDGKIVRNPYYHTPQQTEGIGQKLIQILNQLMNELPRERKARAITVSKALLQQLILDVERDTPPPQTASDRIVQQISVYCQQCFHLPINVAYICDRLNVNHTYASELFHRKTGRMIKEYLQALRLEKAEWLLKYYDHSMEEIAQLCGFSGANYFVRIFHREYGLTPGAYRQQSRYAMPKPDETSMARHGVLKPR